MDRLIYSAECKMIESDEYISEPLKWLAILMAPGSSIGGARLKTNILDDNQHPWIAIFPSKNDKLTMHYGDGNSILIHEDRYYNISRSTRERY